MSGVEDEVWLEKIIDLFRLRKLLSQRLITLSSGQLRRLIIAKALLEKPRMLIFDNPFIGLDVQTRLDMENVFAYLKEQGMQMLFIVDSSIIPASGVVNAVLKSNLSDARFYYDAEIPCKIIGNKMPAAPHTVPASGLLPKR